MKARLTGRTGNAALKITDGNQQSKLKQLFRNGNQFYRIGRLPENSLHW
jgi:hypothetical protein